YAQTYPSKPIKIVVPYPPGGFNDTLGRTLAAKFTEAWGQPAVVENKPGANTVIGVDFVAKSPPDGYTLLVVAFPFAVTPSLIRNMPYDTVRDFAPIALAAQSPNLLVVNPTLPVKSVGELIAAAKAKPEGLSYASTGNGSSNHISMELFKSLAGVKIVHIPYKGSAPAVTDLLGGQVHLMFDNVPNVLPHVKSGRLLALAQTGSKRSALVADIPTVAEAGVPGYEVTVWFGLVAPAGTPREIVQKLNAEVLRILAMPDVRERFLAQGVEPVGSTPEQFGDHIRVQMAKWAKVVADAGVKAE
ncbi:MAG: tripartite tricarboxylate transporter substrate binding protein, partial [Burkholderiales bacterium]|nr:tripartite tricarboxylate transporter substrate binding protein [Burkholderiales bacterium]